MMLRPYDAEANNKSGTKLLPMKATNKSQNKTSLVQKTETD
jgi:hypothetical protein